MKKQKQQLQRDYDAVIINFARFALCGIMAILVMVNFLGNGQYAADGFDLSAAMIVLLLIGACVWFLKRLKDSMCTVISSDKFRKLWEQSVR